MVKQDQRTILVVDDDPIFVKATVAVLEAHGYRALSAKDGDEGLAMMREAAPDLVLLDVMMSWVLDGVNVSRAMMEDSRLRRIPLIMVTSIRNTEYRDAFPQDEYLHADMWLDKPCPPEKLAAEVEAILSQRRGDELDLSPIPGNPDSSGSGSR